MNSFCFQFSKLFFFSFYLPLEPSSLPLLFDLHVSHLFWTVFSHISYLILKIILEEWVNIFPQVRKEQLRAQAELPKLHPDVNRCQDSFHSFQIDQHSFQICPKDDNRCHKGGTWVYAQIKFGKSKLTWFLYEKVSLIL